MFLLHEQVNAVTYVFVVNAIHLPNFDCAVRMIALSKVTVTKNVCLRTRICILYNAIFAVFKLLPFG